METLGCHERSITSTLTRFACGDAAHSRCDQERRAVRRFYCLLGVTVSDHRLMRRRQSRLGVAAIAAMAVLVSGLVFAPAREAAADDWFNRPASGVFQVSGHGEGHGRGMSQYGAQGAAGIGKTSKEILDFYYPGTQATAVSTGTLLRVWISGDTDGVTEVSRTAGLQVRNEATGAVVPIPTGTDRVRSYYSAGAFVVEFRVGGSWQGSAAAKVGPTVAAQNETSESARTSESPPTADLSSTASDSTTDPSGPGVDITNSASVSATTDAEPTVPESEVLEPTAAVAASSESSSPDAAVTTTTEAETTEAETTVGRTTASDPADSASILPGLRSPGPLAAAAAGFVGPISFRETASDTVELFLPSGDRIGYRGTTQAFRDTADGITRTINEVNLENYVQAVVPRESISSWLPAALQSQAVAARTFSYVSVITPRRAGVYNICDTAACQVYGGATLNGVSRLTTNTNNAVVATAGLIRTYNGDPINAQFGSTNGGHSTAGSGNEPYLLARPDPWEALANPPQAYANWKSTISVSQFESRWPGIGTFTRIRITARTGNGDWGGPVVSATIEGTRGARQITGDQLRQTVSGTIRSAYLQISDPDTASLPIGRLDSASVPGPALRVTGWAYDPDSMSDALQIHIYDKKPDGSTTTAIITANTSRPDVGRANPGIGDLHGFDANIPISGRGLHSVCAYGINVGQGNGNPLLGCVRVRVGNPVGTIDSIKIANGQATLTGWTADPAAPGRATQVHLYDTSAAGTVGYSGFTANQTRADVGAAYPGAGNQHGYSASLPLRTPGTHRICAFAIAVVPGGNTLLGCRTVSDSFGRLDTVSSSGNSISVRGWAIDPNQATTAIQVHVYVSGPSGTTGYSISANGARADVGRAYPGTGNQHGYTGAVAAQGKGSNRVCAYAIGSTGNPLIGCQNVVVR